MPTYIPDSPSKIGLTITQWSDSALRRCILFTTKQIKRRFSVSYTLIMRILVLAQFFHDTWYLVMFVERFLLFFQVYIEINQRSQNLLCSFLLLRWFSTRLPSFVKFRNIFLKSIGWVNFPIPQTNVHTRLPPQDRVNNHSMKRFCSTQMHFVYLRTYKRIKRRSSVLYTLIIRILVFAQFFTIHDI